MFALAASLVSAGINLFKGRQQAKAVQKQNKQDLQRAVVDAKIAKVKAGQAGDIAWENTSLEKSGWKSGFLTVVISIPLMMSFIPELAPYVAQGFEALKAVPQWYQAAVGVMIGSAFGVRQFTKFMGIKKGN